MNAILLGLRLERVTPSARRADFYTRQQEYPCLCTAI
jgi:hypothetical protein